MKKIRVLRVLEYTYDTAEHMIADRARWQVQDVFNPNNSTTIKSTVMIPDVSDEDEA